MGFVGDGVVGTSWEVDWTRLNEVQNKLRDLAFDLPEEVRMVFPRPPWILVRVLPKERKTASGIILADGATTAARQNKPVYEGVVLATYQPFTHRERRDGQDVSWEVRPSVRVADHVIFQHWDGTPAHPLLDDSKFRLIREDGIFGLVMYERTSPRDRFFELVKNCLSNTARISEAREIMEAVTSEFDLVPRNVYSRTESGSGQEQ